MFGLLELVLFLAGFSGTPKKAKKCTFFWVFNNSPSRDSLVPFFRFFPTSILANFECRNARVAFLEDVYRIYGESMAQPMPSMSQPMCVGSVIMLSLRLYVSVIANLCHTHCVGDNIIAIVCRCIAIVCHTHCECISLSLRW